MTEARSERHDSTPVMLETNAKYQTHRKHLGKEGCLMLEQAKLAVQNWSNLALGRNAPKSAFSGGRADGKGLPPFR